VPESKLWKPYEPDEFKLFGRCEIWGNIESEAIIFAVEN
jgi:hypothetical protein